MKPSEIITSIVQYPTRCSYVKTEALFHLWGKQNGYTPMHDDAHWFLEHRPSGFIVDISHDGIEINHDDAVIGAFKTQPSFSAQRIIDSVLVTK